MLARNILEPSHLIENLGIIFLGIFIKVRDFIKLEILSFLMLLNNLPKLFFDYLLFYSLLLPFLNKIIL